IYISTNSGAAWRKATATSNSWSSVACSADGTKIIAAGGFKLRSWDPPNEGAVLTSADSGMSWSPAALPQTNWSGVASSADGTTLLAASPSGLLYVSSNSGETWTLSPRSDRWTCAASSADGSKLVAAGSRIFTSAYYGPWRVSGAPITNWTSVA